MNRPLVSVFCFVRNRREMMKACIESVLKQTYRNFEFVIQDGASTDGTVELIRSYDDPRIVFDSRPDRGPSEVFYSVFKKCKGELIGSCLSDEEMGNNAIEIAVNTFQQNPQLGAIHRDTLIVDVPREVAFIQIGKVFSPLEYMSANFTPHFSTAFFSRKALEDIGLYTREWHLDCGEFELWSRLALKYPIAYIPGVASKYTLHNGQLSNNVENVEKLFEGRLQVLNQLFKEYPDKFPDAQVQLACKVSNGVHFAGHLQKECKRDDLSDRMFTRCKLALEGKATL